MSPFLIEFCDRALLLMTLQIFYISLASIGLRLPNRHIPTWANRLGGWAIRPISLDNQKALAAHNITEGLVWDSSAGWGVVNGDQIRKIS